MATVILETFILSARKALAEIVEGEGSAEIFEAFDRKRSQFHFYDDGGLDSLDMLDICFYIERDLKLKLQFEKMVHDNVPMTLRSLYDSVRKDAKTPA